LPCTTNNDCALLLNNNPPSATNLAVNDGSYCTNIIGTGIATFSWTYSDSEGESEKQFRLQIDNNSDFSSPEVDRTFNNLSFPSGTPNQQTVYIQAVAPDSNCNVKCPNGTNNCPGINCDFLKYGTNYYWRVMVRENVTWLYSQWTYYNGAGGTTNSASKTTYQYSFAHPAPAVYYVISPSQPKPNDQVYFQDLSICYNGSLNSYYCQSGASTTYSWNYGDGSAVSHTKADVTHTYTQSKPAGYQTSLSIDDGGPYPCTFNLPIPVQTQQSQNLPKWKEISPF
jgi:hypothetical protein